MCWETREDEHVTNEPKAERRKRTNRWIQNTQKNIKRRRWRWTDDNNNKLETVCCSAVTAACLRRVYECLSGSDIHHGQTTEGHLRLCWNWILSVVASYAACSDSQSTGSPLHLLASQPFHERWTCVDVEKCSNVCRCAFLFSFTSSCWCCCRWCCCYCVYPIALPLHTVFTGTSNAAATVATADDDDDDNSNSS